MSQPRALCLAEQIRLSVPRDLVHECRMHTGLLSLVWRHDGGARRFLPSGARERVDAVNPGFEPRVATVEPERLAEELVEALVVALRP